MNLFENKHKKLTLKIENLYFQISFQLKLKIENTI